jgi:single-strand DNA-binding protein
MITISGHGNLVADPEVRYTGSGKAVATLRVAAWNGKDASGDSKSLFIDLEAWETLAENCERSLRKGDRVTFTGTLREDEWQNKEGETRKKVKIALKEAGAALTWATSVTTKNDKRDGDSDRRSKREDSRRETAQLTEEEPF